MPKASQVTRKQMRARLVRYGELVPCRTAFIDTRTPGSESKENFTIIGPGVAENPDQHVHIREPHGFNIGAARQPPGCVNSQHSHETAEVFWIHSGRWRFMTGEHGEDGEVVLERGDTISIPIHVFRGFENVGSGEGFMFAALGGDDPGRVTWAPYVFDDARRYGLVLLESGRLIDTEAGEAIPDDEPVMPATTAAQVAELTRLDSAALESCVSRYRDTNGSADSVLAQNASRGRVTEEPIIGQDNREEGVSQAPLAWEHGFHLRRLNFAPGACLPAHSRAEEEVWTVHEGHLRITWGRESLDLAPGDVLTIPIDLARTIENPNADPAEAFVVRGGNSPAPPQWT
ncbi:MAG: cupin domain-containing protein [Gammaproteobacteria bacterium]|nr:cupin domain-containing protein [Gammaproteobacteria bacterium]MYF66328.1 cupin domain-containing protein [Gammaproteobacteria bacterium]MYK38345.1 cupin domain-containing protein [Gammaproteobacteria bacterium]